LPLGVYAAPNYLARAGYPDHPRELELPHHRIVGFAWSRTRRVLPCTMHRNSENIDVQGRPASVVDDGNAYLAPGLAAIGALCLPSYMAQAHVARGGLIPLFTDWQLDPMPMYIAFPQNRHVSAKLRVFIDWLVELMAQHAPVVSRPPPGIGVTPQEGLPSPVDGQ